MVAFRKEAALGQGLKGKSQLETSRASADPRGGAPHVNDDPFIPPNSNILSEPHRTHP
ncbi:hypothetical protein GCM10011498_36140 [Amylibacter cionae]|uniref:Uncharacterized protein n=1 Tax=Neptunicoccus cionae TaxID=2035344 RepID=A0A916VSV2_9RHOB|nr:hypothetical protein GCM10011498_36140 [Amylibacter cionae]